MAIALAASLFALTYEAEGQSEGAGSYTAVSRSAHETVWQRVVAETNALTGQITERSHRFVEVGSGLSYLNEAGQWIESTDVVELTPEGGAAAVHGPTKVHFNGNLNSPGAITITTASNRVFRTRPLAVVLFDAASGQGCLGRRAPGLPRRMGAAELGGVQIRFRPAGGRTAGLHEGRH